MKKKRQDEEKIHSKHIGLSVKKISLNFQEMLLSMREHHHQLDVLPVSRQVSLYAIYRYAAKSDEVWVKFLLMCDADFFVPSLSLYLGRESKGKRNLVQHL